MMKGRFDMVDMTALHEAIEENDFLEVSDELAIEAMRQYEMGMIWDPDATDLEKAVLKTRPELSGFNAYDFAGIIYRDYNSRIGYWLVRRSKEYVCGTDEYGNPMHSTDRSCAWKFYDFDVAMTFFSLGYWIEKVYE